MRALLLLAAALALAPARVAHMQNPLHEHIKRQILDKLGLPARPTGMRAPPRDVVRQILARAADPADTNTSHRRDQLPLREVIAIAHRDLQLGLVFVKSNSWMITNNRMYLLSIMAGTTRGQG